MYLPYGNVYVYIKVGANSSQFGIPLNLNISCVDLNPDNF